MTGYSHDAQVTPVIIVPRSSDIVSFLLFFFLPIVFSLCISIWEVSIDISSCSLILSLAMSTLLMGPSKTFFLSVSVSDFHIPF